MEAKSSPLVQTRPLILVVEDNEDLRENAVLVLTLEGYQVASAIDGQHALDMLSAGECRPDLIVSDIAMPRLDGYGFFEAVHNNPLFRTIPFIFLTARGSRRDIRFGKELGADDYLVKPFNADDFLVAVRSKLKRNQEIREQAENDLDDARRRMVQLLSHELRTPLTYVTGGFSLLAEGLEQEDLPSDMQMSMGLIHSGTQRLNHLAEQLVQYAELISGHSKLQLESMGEALNLESLISEVIKSVNREFSSRNIQFVSDYQTRESLEVFSIPELFRTALYEVMRNAGTFSLNGGEVIVRLTNQKNLAQIDIIDQGRGIRAEDQEQIWDILIQSDRPKQEQQGAGMGLPIVKQIMLLHGGDANLISEIDRGTQVTLLVPVYQQI
jgi:signal transduction histidine kinase